MLNAQAKAAMRRYENDLLVAQEEISKMTGKERQLEGEERMLHQQLERTKKEMEMVRTAQEQLKRDRLTLESDISLLKQKMRDLG